MVWLLGHLYQFVTVVGGSRPLLTGTSRSELVIAGSSTKSRTSRVRARLREMSKSRVGARCRNSMRLMVDCSTLAMSASFCWNSPGPYATGGAGGQRLGDRPDFSRSKVGAHGRAIRDIYVHNCPPVPSFVSITVFSTALRLQRPRLLPHLAV
jgi:hypothetical protein